MSIFPQQKPPQISNGAELGMEQENVLETLQQIADKFLKIASETESITKANAALKVVEHAMDIGGRIAQARNQNLNAQLLRELVLGLADNRTTRADLWRSWIAGGGVGMKKGEFSSNFSKWVSLLMNVTGLRTLFHRRLSSA